MFASESGVLNFKNMAHKKFKYATIAWGIAAQYYWRLTPTLSLEVPEPYGYYSNDYFAGLSLAFLKLYVGIRLNKRIIKKLYKLKIRYIQWKNQN